MNTADLAEKILQLLGGKENILSTQGCMTRLRVTVYTMDRVDIPALMNLEDVMGVVKDNPLQIVLGPGRAQKVSMEFMDSLKEGYVKPIPLSVDKSWEANKAAHATHHRHNPFKELLAKISGVFTPLIPAVIAVSLCAGIGGLTRDAAVQAGGVFFYLSQMLSIIGDTFFRGFAVFTGIYAAKAFGASPALGGLMGAFNLSLAAVRIPGGGGGVLGVLLGVWILSLIEKNLRKWMPDVLNLLITPFVSIFVAGAIYFYIIMPFTGKISQYILWLLQMITECPHLSVRFLMGFVLSALFLPIVMRGYHHVFVILYALELQELGSISLLPCLIMAGAGQVGAAIAIGVKCKKAGNQRMVDVVKKALPSGLLGVGEPLIYGVTLPMQKPFLTAGLGAGFGGALCLGAGVRMSAWGISGLAAIPLMKTPSMMLWFMAGLLLSYVMGFVITMLFVPQEVIPNA